MSIRIVVKHRGPLAIDIPAGESVELVDRAGAAIDTGGRTRLLLCRCGASKQRPFCDGSHNRVAFASDDQITEPDQAPDQAQE